MRTSVAGAVGILIGVMSWMPLRGLQTITINDVIGLPTELALRPTKGVGYAPGGVTFVDSSGALESAIGTPTNCVTVAGLSVPCNTNTNATPVPNFVDSEVPSGVKNGVNVTFTLANIPNPASSLHLFLNGDRLTSGVDFSLTGASITLVQILTPIAGDLIVADYRF